MVAGILLFATLALPLGMVAAGISARLRSRLLALLPLAPLPGLLATVLAPAGVQVIAPGPLRMVLVLDTPGALLLGSAALLWSLAGQYAAIYMAQDRRAPRFAMWWLLTLTGSLGLFIVADMASFYLVFALASLSAYGLVSHEATPAARRAAAVYMALAILGEAFLLLGFVMLATDWAAGNPLIADAVARLPHSPHAGVIVSLLILGFGLKMGLAPLHVWMPLAHPVAPMPASAALSGIIVKAGVIGLIRFLPLQPGLPGWGIALMALGLGTAFYGVAVGITQQHPKTVLAYSTVSQMGFLAAVLGAGLEAGGAATAILAAFYALHHLLVKGALFLGVGVVAATGRRRLPWLLAASSVLALSLAGLPFTSGALAKYAVKPLFGYGVAGVLASLAGAGSALLMLHFLRRLAAAAHREPGASAPRGLVLPWAIVALAAFLVPATLFGLVSHDTLSAPFGRAALWAAVWPILIGAVLALVLAANARRLPAVPEGDVIVLVERAAPFAKRLGQAVDRLDGQLKQWGVAVAVLAALALTLAGALAFAA